MQALDKYNKFRSPEATANLLKIKELDNKIEVIIKFEGVFCETCGVNEYVYDLKYIFEDLNVKCEVKKIFEPENFENYRIAKFILL